MSAHKWNPGWFVALTSFFGYAFLVLFGFVRDFARKFWPDKQDTDSRPGYAPILADMDDFYIRRMYGRVQDCWNRPIRSAPSAWIDVWKRNWNPDYKGLTVTDPPETIRCLNLASYNYLGFSQPPENVTKAVLGDLDKYGVATCSPTAEFGFSAVHRELEIEVAEYLRKEDAMIIGMGFATNTTVIPALSDKGTCLISDSLNHASIVYGARTSGAKIKVFKHGDYDHLEHVVRETIMEGQPRTHIPWKKIFILVEGIYSMEGEIVDLKKVVEIKKKYKCYLYVDEAHSIGALGAHGRGVCEQTGVDPKDVDILMGTFTKSFGAVGGYIASSRAVINHLRRKAFAPLYGASVSVPCAQQILSVIRVILGKDGTTIGRDKIKQLHDNANYFSAELKKRGFEILGSPDSPVVVLMLYTGGRVPAFSRECLKRNIAVVVVAAPATPLLEARARFCVSAAHTKEDLDYALKVIDIVGDITLSKFHQSAWKELKAIFS